MKLNERGQIIERLPVTVNRFIEELGNGVQLAMVEIPAGKFLMGSVCPKKEILYRDSPQHLVQVPRFYLGQALITQAQWQALMGANPAYFKGDDNLPVECVSWLEAIKFCEKLSAKTGRIYRLPTEAEWEYACRAGAKTPFAFGEAITAEIVNYNGAYQQQTTPVGKFPANSFGLYDMHGNLWEWCLDEWIYSYKDAPVDGSARGDVNSRDSKKKHVVRGGSWININSEECCRSNSRFSDDASVSSRNVGLRVVAVPVSTPSRQNS